MIAVIRIKPIFVLICAFLCSGSHLRSEHIIGGEMYYECVSPGVYDFTMKLYRDCFSAGAGFDNPAYFNVFDENNALVEIIQSSVTTVQNVNTNVASPCMVLPPNICVEEGIYTFTVVVENLDEPYQVVYQRCCRNGTIQNLNDPGAQGLSIVSTIPPFDEVGCNSSPSFNNFPPPVLCAQELLEFDHSATDSDGDSLAYSLCAPFIGGTQVDPLPVPASNPPYNEVVWAAGFGPENPLQGNPGLTVDPVTGLLSGVPTILGQYVIGVCVEEWRDGQLLSVNTRDFQFNVAFCEPPSDALIAMPDVEDLCQGLTVNFSTPSSPTNNFFWDFGDEGADDPFSEAMNPTHTFSDTGTYVITLITNPGFFCSDTTSLTLPIFYAAQISAFPEGFICAEGVQEFAFSATGEYDDGAPINWDFGPGATPQFAEGEIVSGVVFPGPGMQTVTVEVLNNACSAEDVIEVTVDPPIALAIDPQTEFCNGYTYNFTQQNENATSFIWDFGTGSDGAVSTNPSPSYTFPGDGAYTVSLTASSSGTCPVTVEEVFDIHSLLAPQAPSFPIQCFNNHSFNFVPEGSYSGSATFEWSFENAVPSVANTSSVSDVLFLEPGSHSFSLTISENGCTRTAEGNVNLHVNPLAYFDAAPVVGCAPLEVHFRNRSETMSTNAAFRWNLGDGSPEVPFVSSHVYTQPGVYTVSLSLENLDGCIGLDELVREAYIEVLPTPTPGFALDPLVVSAIDPEVTVTDMSSGATSCTYFFDNQEFNNCNFSHTLQNVYPQTVTQRVSNGYGCSAEMDLTFRVADHLIYVPNAFTPDGDGVNELFEPVITGASHYDMYIIDRWGREVFAGQELGRGWNGADVGGDHFAQAGVYQYVIIVTDYSGWKFEYTGNVLLVR